MSLAARVESWRRHKGAWATPARGTGSVDLTHPVVEIFVHSAWTDISSYVRWAEGVKISRGRSDEASRLQPGRCTLVLDNRDGRFSERFPTGPYFGQIGRNTPIRVWVAEGEIRRYRFAGEVTGWPQRWDSTGTDTRVEISASGIMQRLQQPGIATRSTLYRGLTLLDREPIAYWSCEDTSGASQLASGLPGRVAMTFTGSPTLSSYSGFDASESLPLVKSSIWRGQVREYTETDEAQVRFLLHIPDDGLTDNAIIMRVRTSGTASIWHITYTTASSGGLHVVVGDQDGTTISTGSTLTGYDGKDLRISLEMTQDGADLDYSLDIHEAGTSSSVGTGSTISSTTFGSISSVVVDHRQEVDDAAVGHISVHDAILSLDDLIDEMNAYDGETAGRRIQRLCEEEGVSLIPVGDLDDTEAMGVQAAGTLTGLIEECVDADLGILFEPTSIVGVGYRTRKDLYNQAVKVALDYSAGELFDALKPDGDDKDIVNRQTVARDDGSSATVELASGALSVQPPPNGVYPYPDRKTVNVQTDDQLADEAGWRVRLGTEDVDRYPKVTVYLANSRIAADTGLVANVLGAELGDRVTIDNLVTQASVNTVEQLIQGSEETIRNPEHDVTFVCSPGGPYNVAVTPGTSDTAEGFPDASLNVTINDGGDAAWARDSAESNFGNWSLKSGSITDDQTSDAILTIPTKATSLTFYYKVSSEAGFDFFSVLVDSTTVLQASGEVDWTRYVVNVATADTVTFRYAKDGSVSDGSDAAWIDDLLLAITDDSTPAGTTRGGTSGSEVAESTVTEAETLIDVHTTSATGLRWVTSDGVGGTHYSHHFPFDILIGGERMRVTGCEAGVWDTFSRTETDTWGTSSSGHTWSLIGGDDSDRDVDGSEGTVVLATDPETIRFQLIGAEITDSEQIVAITPDQVATGAAFLPALVFRSDETRYYRCRLVLNTDQTIDLQTTDIVDTVDTETTPSTYEAATKIWLRARLDGQRLRGRAWVDGEGEPGFWQIDSTMPAGSNTFGSFGISASAFPSNTNTNPTFAYDDYELLTPQEMTVTRSINGVAKIHSRGDAVELFQPAYTAW